ncbi:MULTISPECIES: serine/threonine-protein kinase [unclassified Moorena]|uniref:serine/threonine-protein kinase n=1 Tax=unclassified Moorena TaxID=2683338 RepID=UPI0013FFFAA2|nr:MULTISPECIES: serine/threonine-protein kinase [unclassified Moorena]NEO14502.1 tetratricopeptide repeat protein [Moorena sp. SIO3E8]NEQ01838.1 tetratricopeptide repeat protein [Moorena sp. SIO3F7]
MSPLSGETKPAKALVGGRYKIINQLGAGGFGRTFLAQDIHLPNQPQCVVKHLLPQTEQTATLQMARRLFDREARFLYQLGNHDQIPRLLAHFEEDQQFYLVQELIEGQPLNRELVKGHPCSQERVIALLIDILQVLAFVHQQQIIHRDIKPSNLIRRQGDDKIVLIDFGAVKQVSSQNINPETGETHLTVSIGTQGYMPHEQLAGRPRFSSDIYAVGMVGIQALTGVHPKNLKENPTTSEIDWQHYAKQVSPELAHILDIMVRYDFRDRYQTAAEALEVLASLPRQQLLSLAEEEIPTQEITGESQSGMELPIPDIRKLANTTVPSSMITRSQSRTTPQLDITEHSRGSATNRTTLSIPQRLVKLGLITVSITILGVGLVLLKTFLSAQATGENTDYKADYITEYKTDYSTEAKVTAEQLLDEADQLRKSRQYQEALKLYDQAIAKKADFAQAYWGRCYSLNKLQQPEMAVVACNDALYFKPNYPEAVWSLGQAFDQQQRSVEALRLYNQALTLKPDLTEAWLSQGITLQKLGRSVEAITALEKAIALQRDLAEAWMTKGEAQITLGRFNQAITSLNKALQIEPNHRNALKLRQQARKELKR